MTVPMIGRLGMAAAWLLLFPVATAVALDRGVTILKQPTGNLIVSKGRDGLLVIGDVDIKRPALIAATLGGEVPKAIVDTDPDTGFIMSRGDGSVLYMANGRLLHATLDGLLKVPSSKMSAATPTRLIVALADSDTVHLNGDEIGLFRVQSGLVAGACAALFPAAHLLHVGRLYTPGQYPAIDVARGGSISGLIGAVGRLINIGGPEVQFVPAHGEPVSRDRLIAYRNMLMIVRNRVQAAMQRGQTLKQIQAARLTADLDPRWARGPVQGADFVARVHASLLKPPGEG
ncbi:hypothetical protein [Nevskia sp.]|uniref:hypothetical protein n=1 Tax=Nevskia sp. TaxID=1929292 RepID=UPI0025D9A867|nr:hypothetical protein [Nevskia sp.]